MNMLFTGYRSSYCKIKWSGREGGTNLVPKLGMYGTVPPLPICLHYLVSGSWSNVPLLYNCLIISFDDKLSFLLPIRFINFLHI
jgi:hypothetical protein